MTHAPVPSPGTAAPAVTAVGVLVPAHDEAATVGACVRSVLTALDAVLASTVGPGVGTTVGPGVGSAGDPGAGSVVLGAVCVVADRCCDDTAERARAAAAAHPAAGRIRFAVVEPEADVAALTAPTPPADPPGPLDPASPPERSESSGRSAPVAPGTIGSVRALGARTVLDLLAADGATPAGTWLLGTDADGVVVPGWVRAHLDLAAAGADAVAGGVVLDVAGLPRPPGEPAHPEHPVYAANLGVRADAYLDVGGYPPLACGEDHGLVARLRAGGHRVVAGAPGTVRTSARTRGRARGGLADLLRGAATGVPPGSPTRTAGAGRPVA